MKKVDLLYEGKAKKVYTTEDPDILIVDYKDDATAMDGLKKGTIVGKGAINNRLTNHIFKLLEKEGIPTHYVEELSDRETAVKKVEIVPLEVIIQMCIRDSTRGVAWIRDKRSMRKGMEARMIKKEAWAA